MAQVWARRGPLAGRRVEIPDDEIETATAENGWAQKLEPGTQLETDSSAPLDPKWKIPGVDTSTGSVPVVEGKTVKAKPAAAEDKPAAAKKKT